MKQVTIDRQLWGRGETGGKLSRSGKDCCCLSFVCNQLYDVPWSVMSDVCMPRTVLNADACPLLVEGNDPGPEESTTLANDASSANDDNNTTDEEKEETITNMFADEGIEIKFIN